jgi:hypothetical protein
MTKAPPPLRRCRLTENREPTKDALPVLPDQAGDDTDRPIPDWGGFGMVVASSAPDRPRWAQKPRWRRNVQVDQSPGNRKWMVNRAYPERNTALSAPDRTKYPGFPRLTGMDYQTSILKVLSQNDRKSIAKSTLWRPRLT